jgi:hypothetical protein
MTNDSHSSVEPLIFVDQEGKLFVGGSYYQSPRGRTSFVDATKNLGIDNHNLGDTPQFRSDSGFLTASMFVNLVVESSSTHSYTTSSTAAAADNEYESDVDSLNGSDPYAVIDEDSISLVMRIFLHVVFYFFYFRHDQNLQSE